MAKALKLKGETERGDHCCVNVTLSMCLCVTFGHFSLYLSLSLLPLHFNLFFSLSLPGASGRVKWLRLRGHLTFNRPVPCKAKLRSCGKALRLSKASISLSHTHTHSTTAGNLFAFICICLTPRTHKHIQYTYITPDIQVETHVRSRPPNDINACLKYGSMEEIHTRCKLSISIYVKNKRLYH